MVEGGQENGMDEFEHVQLPKHVRQISELTDLDEPKEVTGHSVPEVPALTQTQPTLQPWLPRKPRPTGVTSPSLQAVAARCPCAFQPSTRGVIVARPRSPELGHREPLQVSAVASPASRPSTGPRSPGPARPSSPILGSISPVLRTVASPCGQSCQSVLERKRSPQACRAGSPPVVASRTVRSPPTVHRPLVAPAGVASQGGASVAAGNHSPAPPAPRVIHSVDPLSQSFRHVTNLSATTRSFAYGSYVDPLSRSFSVRSPTRGSPLTPGASFVAGPPQVRPGSCSACPPWALQSYLSAGHAHGCLASQPWSPVRTAQAQAYPSFVAASPGSQVRM